MARKRNIAVKEGFVAIKPCYGRCRSRVCFAKKLLQEFTVRRNKTGVHKYNCPYPVLLNCN